MIQQNSTRAVSPVISVILMLGLAVSIAAIASLTAFNLQQGVSQNADVSLNIDTGANTVAVVDNANAQKIELAGDDTGTLDSAADNDGDGFVDAGSTINYGPTGDFRVTATVDGETQLIRQFSDSSP